MKATAIAPSNIAFIKYWGKADEELRLPSNSSISMNLNNLLTTTTVEFDSRLLHDDVLINNQHDVLKKNRVVKHLDRIRNLANISYKAKVVSQNNFPSSTGLSSSASAFAALTVAGSSASGLSLPEKELTVLARLGSGSASRSIPDGFVQWKADSRSEESYAYSLFPKSHWDIADAVVILSEKEKDVPTSVGQTYTRKNHFFQTRLKHIDEKLSLCKTYIQEKNFPLFGELIEQEALELHAIMMTTTPYLLYLFPETVSLIKIIRKWRDGGLPVYFTLNTGQNMHLICEKINVKKLVSELKKIKEVKEIIVNYPTIGTRLTDKHLF